MPGRFLVQDILKLIFVYMLIHYGFKFPEEGKTPSNSDMPNGFMTPDVAMQ